jgi:putative lipoic acid-binding regulatory protein
LTASDDDARQRAIDLLEANHVFPGEFSLSVIARSDEAITSAILAGARHGLPDPLRPEAHQIKPSAGGRYLSHRLLVPCQSAADVLDLFARMRAIDGVVTVL